MFAPGHPGAHCAVVCTLTCAHHQTADFVREELAGNDASHDFDHIQRVRNMALYFAKEEVCGDLSSCSTAVPTVVVVSDCGDVWWLLRSGTGLPGGC